MTHQHGQHPLDSTLPWTAQPSSQSICGQYASFDNIAILILLKVCKKTLLIGILRKKAVGDPRFAKGGANHKGVPNYYWAKSSWKSISN